MSAIIVSGGCLSSDVLKWTFHEAEADLSPVVVIAADRGIEGLRDFGRKPDYIVGDFDSASSEALAYAKSLEGANLTILPCEKDITDTEAALKLALEHSKGTIYIVGATGSRLDHVMGNFMILEQGIWENREIYLVDAHNRVRMITSSTRIRKVDQYGRYVSLIPWGGPAKGVSASGFKYPVAEFDFPLGTALGISNEISEEEGVITIEEGCLLIIESRD